MNIKLKMHKLLLTTLIVLNIKFFFIVNGINPELEITSKKNKDTQRSRYTTVIDILSDNIEKFKNILNFFREADEINYLNEINSTEFTILLPNDKYFTEWNESILENFDVDKLIVFDRIIDFKSNVSSSIDSVLISWDYYPLVFETFNGKVSFYQQGHMLDDFSNDIKDRKGEIIGLKNKLIERPSEQNCQIYETTQLLPFKKLSNKELINAYSEKKINLKYMSNLLQFYETDFHLLRNFINNTFIITKDESIEELFGHNPIEINYIFGTDPEVFLSQFNFDDSIKSDLVWDQQHFINGTVINGLLGQGLDAEGLVETLNGKPTYSLNYRVKNNGFTISLNDFESTSSPNIISYRDLEEMDYGMGERYGLSYIFDSFENDITQINFTLQKYLIGLKAYDFLQEMYFRDLNYLLTSKKETTLFLYVDDYTNTANGIVYEGFSKKNLIYHFIEEKVDIEEDFQKPKKSQMFQTDEGLKTKSILYSSMLCEFNKNMGKHCQKLKILKTENDQYFINTLQSYKILNAREPIMVGNSYIYIIHEPLELPGSIIQSVGSEFIHSSQSLIFLQNLNLLNLPLNTEGYTVFLPNDNAWQALDLNLEYLKKNINILNKFLKSYIWEGLVYTDIKTPGKYNNLEGEVIEINGIKQYEDSLMLKSNTQDLRIYKGQDILFEQGVIHPVDTLTYPPDIQISLTDLMETTGNGLDFMIYLDDIPELKDLITSNQNYSFIVPTSSAMLKDEQFNVNATDFVDLMKLHVINPNSTDLMKNCMDSEAEISTLLDNTSVYCKKIEMANNPPAFFLILKNKQGDEKKIRVLQQGCQTSNFNSCIYIVDEPVSLKWLKSSPLLELHMNLSWQSFIMGLVAGIFVLLGGQACSLMLSNYLKEVSLIDEDGNEGDEPGETSFRARNDGSIRSRPSQKSLLHDENNQVVGAKYGSIFSPTAAANLGPSDMSNGNFEAGYSENSQSRPISVQKQKSQLFATDF